MGFELSDNMSVRSRILPRKAQETKGNLRLKMKVNQLESIQRTCFDLCAYLCVDKCETPAFEAK